MLLLAVPLRCHPEAAFSPGGVPVHEYFSRLLVPGGPLHTSDVGPLVFAESSTDEGCCMTYSDLCPAEYSGIPQGSELEPLS